MATLIRVNPARIAEYRGRLTKAQQRAIDIAESNLDIYGSTLTTAIQQEAPQKTGRLQSSIRYQIWGRGTKNMQLRVSIGHPEEPKDLPTWLLYGTGIYGPRATPIVPKRAPFLQFYSEKLGHVIRKKSVRGMKPNNFLQRALDRTLPQKRSLAGRIGRLVVELIKDPRK